MLPCDESYAGWWHWAGAPTLPGGHRGSSCELLPQGTAELSGDIDEEEKGGHQGALRAEARAWHGGQATVLGHSVYGRERRGWTGKWRPGHRGLCGPPEEFKPGVAKSNLCISKARTGSCRRTDWRGTKR